MDDLKALRDEIAGKPAGKMYPHHWAEEWAARLTSIIERNEKERADLARNAKIVCDMLELGDQRLLAMDAHIGDMLPELSAKEWGVVYRACQRIGGRALTELAKEPTDG